jgi:hypothetical protein
MRRVRNRWGEPVFLFIACLLQHARDRYYIAGDDDSWLDIPYWVCAYANNQHAYAPFASNSPCLQSAVRGAEQRARRLGSDVTDDPAASSFAKAMARSIGTVTIIDANAEVARRIWWKPRSPFRGPHPPCSVHKRDDIPRMHAAQVLV